MNGVFFSQPLWSCGCCGASAKFFDGQQKKKTLEFTVFYFGLGFSLHMQINLSVPSVSAATVYVLFRPRTYTLRREARAFISRTLHICAVRFGLDPSILLVGYRFRNWKKKKKTEWPKFGVCIPWNKYKSIWMCAFLKLCPFHVQFTRSMHCECCYVGWSALVSDLSDFCVHFSRSQINCIPCISCLNYDHFNFECCHGIWTIWTAIIIHANRKIPKSSSFMLAFFFLSAIKMKENTIAFSRKDWKSN